MLYIGIIISFAISAFITVKVGESLGFGLFVFVFCMVCWTIGCARGHIFTNLLTQDKRDKAIYEELKRANDLKERELNDKAKQ